MMNVSLVIGVCLAAFLSACASQTTSMHKTDAKEPSECVVKEVNSSFAMIHCSFTVCYPLPSERSEPRPLIYHHGVS